MNKDKAKLLKTIESLDDGVCYITQTISEIIDELWEENHE